MLHSLSPSALLLLLCVIGATVRHGAGDEKTEPLKGVARAFGWAFLSALIVAGLCDYCAYEVSLWHGCAGGGLAYLGPEVSGAIRKHGADLLDNPTLLLKELAPDFLKRVFTPKSPNNETAA